MFCLLLQFLIRVVGTVDTEDTKPEVVLVVVDVDATVDIEVVFVVKLDSHKKPM